jgi:hypothetical protein
MALPYLINKYTLWPSLEAIDVKAAGTYTKCYALKRGTGTDDLVLTDLLISFCRVAWLSSFLCATRGRMGVPQLRK